LPYKTNLLELGFLIQLHSDSDYILHEIVLLKQLKIKRGWEWFIFFQKKMPEPK